MGECQSNTEAWPGPVGIQTRRNFRTGQEGGGVPFKSTKVCRFTEMADLLLTQAPLFKEKIDPITGVCTLLCTLNCLTLPKAHRHKKVTVTASQYKRCVSANAVGLPPLSSLRKKKVLSWVRRLFSSICSARPGEMRLLSQTQLSPKRQAPLTEPPLLHLTSLVCGAVASPPPV